MPPSNPLLSSPAVCYPSLIWDGNRQSRDHLKKTAVDYQCFAIVLHDTEFALAFLTENGNLRTFPCAPLSCLGIRSHPSPISTKSNELFYELDFFFHNKKMVYYIVCNKTIGDRIQNSLAKLQRKMPLDVPLLGSVIELIQQQKDQKLNQLQQQQRRSEKGKENGSHNQLHSVDRLSALANTGRGRLLAQAASKSPSSSDRLSISPSSCTSQSRYYGHNLLHPINRESRTPEHSQRTPLSLTPNLTPTLTPSSSQSSSSSLHRTSTPLSSACSTPNLSFTPSSKSISKNLEMYQNDQENQSHSKPAEAYSFNKYEHEFSFERWRSSRQRQEQPKYKGSNAMTTKSNESITSKAHDHETMSQKPKSVENKEVDRGEAQGFKNIGNSCYMNSVLQCLLNLTDFVSDCVSLLDLLAFAIPIASSNSSSLSSSFTASSSSSFPFLSFSRITDEESKSNTDAQNTDATIRLSSHSLFRSFVQVARLYLDKQRHIGQRKKSVFNADFSLKKKEEEKKENRFFSFFSLPAESKQLTPLNVDDDDNDDDKDDALDLSFFKNRFGIKFKNFSNSRQQDAHEFLISILDLLNEDIISFFQSSVEQYKKRMQELKYNRNNNVTTIDSDSNGKGLEVIVEEGEDDVDDDHPPNPSNTVASLPFQTILTKLPSLSSISPLSFSQIATLAQSFSPCFQHFQGEICKKLTCSNPSCAYERVKSENFMVLSLDFPEKQNEKSNDTSISPAYQPITSRNGIVSIPHYLVKSPGSSAYSASHQSPFLSTNSASIPSIDSSSTSSKPNSPLSLLSLIQSFFQPHTVEYRCEKCSNNKVSISLSLSSLPRVLILHLKRFSLSSSYSFASSSKRPDPVETNLRLHLHSVCNKTKMTFPTQPLSPSDIEATLPTTSAITPLSRLSIASPYSSSSFVASRSIIKQLSTEEEKEHGNGKRKRNSASDEIDNPEEWWHALKTARKSPVPHKKLRKLEQLQHQQILQQYKGYGVSPLSSLSEEDETLKKVLEESERTARDEENKRIERQKKN